MKEGAAAVSFCGICIEKTNEGIFIHQKPYIKDLLKKNQLEGCNATKILLDKESDDADKTIEETEELKEWKNLHSS